MAAQTFNQLKTTLNTRIGDTDNFTFTDEEKTEALTEAFNDHQTVKEVWDSSLAFDQNTYQYAKPSGVDVLQDIYIRPSNATDTEPEKIASDLWEVVDENIHFKNGANRHIPDGYTLYLKGNTKYTVSDSIVETNVQEFVLNLAIANLLGVLGHKKAFKFLKNDTSVSEMIAIKREADRKVLEYRQRLPRRFENA